MEAKDKARELVHSFLTASFGSMEEYVPVPYVFAKQCALIAVGEVEKALTEYGRANDELQNMDREFNYWQEVRKEIEKL